MKPHKWIGVDGEGIGRHPHRYVLLASSTGKYVENLRGLPTAVCLDFLLSLAGRKRRLCGYYLHYDWTKVLEDLPDSAIYRLFRPELRALPRTEGGGFSRIHWGRFRLHFLNGMMYVSDKDRAVTVWDVGKFFQCPFVESLETWQLSENIDEIKEMKARREGFTLHDYPRIKEYCLQECKSLASLMTSLEGAHEDCGLTPKVWFGPGSTAEKALKKIGIQQHVQSEDILTAADHAFFGGRFENSRLGTVEPVYGYDIASAYPFAAYNLPCLQHATWYRRNKPRQGEYALVEYHARLKPATWGPLPVRLTNGNILFPYGDFTGFCWSPEYWEAMRHPGKIRVLNCWSIGQNCDCRPFKRVLDWYLERIALGKSGRGRILKLALNSIYGKLAQSIGVPKYASRVWAGLITSMTRARLLEMIRKHHDSSSVIALATDGLYSTEDVLPGDAPLEACSLGSWEKEHHGRMVFVRPGVYWSDTDNIQRGRGMGRSTLERQRDRIRVGITNREASIELGGIVRFGGAKVTVYRTRAGVVKRSKRYGEWHLVKGSISLAPGPKRGPGFSMPEVLGVHSQPYSTTAKSVDGRVLAKLEDLIEGSL